MEMTCEGVFLPLTIIQAVLAACVSAVGKYSEAAFGEQFVLIHGQGVPALLRRGVGMPGNLRALWNFALFETRGPRTIRMPISKRKWRATRPPIRCPRWKTSAAEPEYRWSA